MAFLSVQGFFFCTEHRIFIQIQLLRILNISACRKMMQNVSTLIASDIIVECFIQMNAS